MFAATNIQLKAQQIELRGIAPPTVVVGAQFQLVYTINSTKGTDLRLDPNILEHFDILAGPSISTARNEQIINGKKSSSTETTNYTYVFSAKKEGTFTIAPAIIQVGRAEYKSNELIIKVLPPDQAQQGGGTQQLQSAGGSNVISNENLFVRVIVSKRDVYEQEGFLVTFKLYNMYNLGGFNGAKFPEFEGFLSQEVDLGEQQWLLENYNGKNYQTAILKQVVLFPQRSGQIQIGSGKLDVVVRVRNQARQRSFFQDFFDTYQNVSKELTTPPVTINVKPLPFGKPASFSGAVGDFTIKSEINRTEMKVNEALTIKLTIRGNGNVKLVKTPEIKFPNDFEPYEPKVDNSKIHVSTAGVSGAKTIEYMAIPRCAGDFEIPAIPFSYFDPKSGTYNTLATDSYQLHVEKGEGGMDAPVMSSYTNRESVQFLGKDIRYIKTKGAHFVSNNDIFFGSFIYIIAYLMITILFIVFFIIYRKQVKENSDLALVRTKRANKMASKRLKEAEKLLKENKEEAFYDEMLRALWGYLSDKLNIPQSELSKDNVAVELTKYGVDEQLSNEFLEIINTCEFARYAPNKTFGAMDKLFSETINAIGKMEMTLRTN
jgi:hypothetical protein